MGILIITHHDRLLEHNAPDFTHVMLGGRIVETGGVELARELYTEGYDRDPGATSRGRGSRERNGRRGKASRQRRQASNRDTKRVQPRRKAERV